MRVMRPNVRLQGEVQQLAVEILLLLLQGDVLVLVHRGQEGSRSGQPVPGGVEVGWDGVRGGAVGRQGGDRGGGGGGGRVQQEGSGVVDVSLKT